MTELSATRNAQVFPGSALVVTLKTQMQMKKTRIFTTDCLAANGAMFNFDDAVEIIHRTVSYERWRHGWGLSDADWADIIQDACTKVWRYRESFDPAKSKLSTWVGTTTRNVLMDRLDRGVIKLSPYDELDDDDPAKELLKQYPELGDNFQTMSESRCVPFEYAPQGDDENEDEGYTPPEFEIAAGSRSAAYEAESHEAVDRIGQAIGLLSENQRFVINLTLDGYKPQEIAELIGCSANAVSGLLFRGRKALRGLLGYDFLLDHGLAA